MYESNIFFLINKNLFIENKAGILLFYKELEIGGGILISDIAVYNLNK
jgi:hypothetical protein